jgi:hypothetical protein
MLFITFFPAFVQGQGRMYVHNLDGKYQSFLVGEIDKLTFSDENMHVAFVSEPLKNYAIPEIKYCNFKFLTDWDNSQYAIRVFPNPTINEIYIESTIEISEIILYNIIGQKLMTVNPRSGMIKMKLNDFSSGFYVLQMETPEGIILEKIIKQ